MPMPAAQPAEPMAALPPLTMPQPAMAAPAEELALSLEDIELRTIQQAVDAAGGNISVAAKRLGISRNTIYRKLRWRNEPRG